LSLPVPINWIRAGQDNNLQYRVIFSDACFGTPNLYQGIGYFSRLEDAINFLESGIIIQWLLDDGSIRRGENWPLPPNPQQYLVDFEGATSYNPVMKKHLVGFTILPDYWSKDSPYYSDDTAWITMDNEPIAGHILCHSPEAGSYAEIYLTGFGVSTILKIDFVEGGNGFDSYFQTVGWKDLYSGYFEIGRDTYSAVLQQKIADSPAQKLRQ